MNAYIKGNVMLCISYLLKSQLHEVYYTHKNAFCMLVCLNCNNRYTICLGSSSSSTGLGSHIVRQHYVSSRTKPDHPGHEPG